MRSPGRVPGVPEGFACHHAGSVKATGSLRAEVPVSNRLGGRAATERLTSDSGMACVSAGGVRPSNPSDEVGTLAYGAGRARASQMDQPPKTLLPWCLSSATSSTTRAGLGSSSVLLDQSSSQLPSIFSPPRLPSQGVREPRRGKNAAPLGQQTPKRRSGPARDAVQLCQKRLGSKASFRRSIQ